MRHGHIVLASNDRSTSSSHTAWAANTRPSRTPSEASRAGSLMPVALLHHLAFRLGLGQVDLQQGIACPRLGRDGP